MWCYLGGCMQLVCCCGSKRPQQAVVGCAAGDSQLLQRLHCWAGALESSPSA